MVENSIQWPVPEQLRAWKERYEREVSFKFFFPCRWHQPLERWVCMLHWLGWARPPGSLVSALKRVPLKNGASIAYPGLSDFAGEYGPGPPIHFSTIVNLFINSAWAIEWVLSSYEAAGNLQDKHGSQTETVPMSSPPRVDPGHSVGLSGKRNIKLEALDLHCKHPGLSDPDIAARLGCHRGTVSKALSKLRQAEGERACRGVRERQSQMQGDGKWDEDDD